MSDYLQLGVAGIVLLGSTIVVLRHLVARRRAGCTGTCTTCPRGGEKTGESSCGHASSEQPELTNIRGR